MGLRACLACLADEKVVAFLVSMPCLDLDLLHKES